MTKDADLRLVGLDPRQAHPHRDVAPTRSAGNVEQAVFLTHHWHDYR